MRCYVLSVILYLDLKWSIGKVFDVQYYITSTYMNNCKSKHILK